MATLDYQHGGDAHREDKKRFRLKWFGPSQADVWARLAEEVGGKFTDAGWFSQARVEVEVGPWQLVLDTYVVSTGKTYHAYTRMRAPYVNADNFRFCIFRRHFLSGIAEALGFQDVEVGHKEFDEQFIIRGNDESKLRRLFASERIRSLIQQHPEIKFEVKDDEGTFRKQFPEGVDALYFVVSGVVKDEQRLKLMYDLFAETLQELCRMGSAYERDPNVKLK